MLRPMGSVRGRWWRTVTVGLPTWRGAMALLAAGLLFLGLAFTCRSAWLPLIAGQLVYEGPVAPADALVVENYGHDYLAFERAAELMHEGYAHRVFVPVFIFRNPDRPGLVSGGFAEVMIRVAGLENVQLVPVQEREPITLSVARQVAETLVREKVRSVIVVSPFLRSARSCRVYRQVLEPKGIEVCCQASSGNRSASNWWHSLHGIQEVGLELVKYWYYRLWVLR
jgi:hypothetical protein